MTFSRLPGRGLTVAGLLLLGSAGAGCRSLFLPLIGVMDPPTKTVAAEYPYLAERKVCLAVWADSNTLFEYPNVQFELSEHVAAALAGTVEKIDLIPNREVVDVQAANPNWDREPSTWIGQQVGAERIVLIELIEYTTREPGATHLLRGRISANLKVYDTAYADAGPVYRSQVEVQYPKGDAAAFGETENSVRRSAMELFAAEAAGKFHERKVKVE